MTIKMKDYWSLTRREQEALKVMAPAKKVRSYSVKGRLSIQWQENGEHVGVGVSVDANVLASSVKEAAELVRKGRTVYYPEGAKASWLNDGPEVK